MTSEAVLDLIQSLAIIGLAVGGIFNTATIRRLQNQINRKADR